MDIVPTAQIRKTELRFHCVRCSHWGFLKQKYDIILLETRRRDIGEVNIIKDGLRSAVMGVGLSTHAAYSKMIRSP